MFEVLLTTLCVTLLVVFESCSECSAEVERLEMFGSISSAEPEVSLFLLVLGGKLLLDLQLLLLIVCLLCSPLEVTMRHGSFVEFTDGWTAWKHD